MLYRRFSLALLILLFSTGLFLCTAQSAIAATPTSTIWYFPEGYVGNGYKTYLSLSNPGNTVCTGQIKYLYTLDNTVLPQTKIVPFSVTAQSRYTASVNADLRLSELNPAAAVLSTIITVDTNTSPNCSGIVAERPMYMRSNGVQSGTDVLGMTQLRYDSFLSDVTTGPGIASFVSILNPNNASANVVVTYYNATNGMLAYTDALQVAANSRATSHASLLNLPVSTTVYIHSDQPIAVEHSTYYNTTTQKGASDISATGIPQTNWYFAEGNTAAGQEVLKVANFNDTAAQFTVTLRSTTGVAQTFPAANTFTVPSHGQYVFNVDDNNTYMGSTVQVSAEIDSTSSLVVQKQMTSAYTSGNENWQAQYVTDTAGGATLANSYTFGEGFTSTGYNEYLLLLNPTANSLSVVVTLSNMLSHSDSITLTLPAQSRLTFDVTNAVATQLAHAGEDARAYAISMTVTGNGNFVAERTMYWHTPGLFSTQGAESIVGYTGN